MRQAVCRLRRRTVHAGESSGPEGVWDAIELLGADRIDHGVRAIEDPALVGLLAERRIALGICTGSNLALKVYPSLAAHPRASPTAIRSARCTRGWRCGESKRCRGTAAPGAA